MGMMEPMKGLDKRPGSDVKSRMAVFTRFAEFVQADEAYYMRGKPTSVGVIEEVMGRFGLDYEIGNVPVAMHRENLNMLKEYVRTEAGEKQLQFMLDVVDDGSIPR